MKSNFDIRVEKVHLLPAMVGLHCIFPQEAMDSADLLLQTSLSRPMNVGLYVDLGQEMMQNCFAKILYFNVSFIKNITWTFNQMFEGEGGGGYKLMYVFPLNVIGLQTRQEQICVPRSSNAK